MKRFILKSTAIMLCALCGHQVQAQRPLSQELLQHKVFGRYLDPRSLEGWIEFRDNAPYSATEVFTQQPELLGMKSDDELKLIRSRTDAVGNVHRRFAQYYKGVRIEAAEYLSHERKGKVYLVNGDFIQDLHLDVRPLISGEQAIELALKTVPARKYMWEVEQREEQYRKKQQDQDATLYPQPELLIVKRDVRGEKSASNYVLAFRVAVFAEEPFAAEYVYVDAVSGSVIRMRDLALSCNEGTAETTFNGTQTVYTNYTTYDCGDDQIETTDYFTWDDCNPDTEIQSWFVFEHITGDVDAFLCDENNVWDENSGSEQMTISTLWGVKQAYRYYYNTWGHESFDGSDGLIDAYSNRKFEDDDGDEYCGNARFVNIIDNVEFGSGPDCISGNKDDYNTDDIVGHEYTHGVIEYAHLDALDYSDESGALNESFADIFGEAVERYVEGANDWWSGFDRENTFGNQLPIRCYFNPDTLGDPDTYLGDNWYSGEDDNGGVHTNSGVQNHMFYLLSEGGTGTNDLGWDYHVTGIGFSDAISIAWQAMMEYLDGDDGYVTARNAWIQSAKDLYGSCSQEVVSVGEAWLAAGVTHYTSYNLGSVCGTYSSPLPLVIDGAREVRNASILFNEYLLTCAATISAPAIVTLSSGNVIQLFPGFTASSGSVFTAQIDECEMSDYNPDDLRAEPGTASGELLNATSVLDIFPVPSDDACTISFDLRTDFPVTMYLADATGKIQMRILDKQSLIEQKYSMQISTKTLISGLYLCVLEAGDKVFTKKFLVQH
jgi:Zn-dependent metalloprotease